MGSEGWGEGGGCGGGAGGGGRGVCGVGGGGAVSAFRVGCAGADGCCGAVLYGSCCRFCVGAASGLARVAARGVGLRLLLCGCLRLGGFRNGCHGHRRADHGRARDRAEQVVKGSFHSGASRRAANRVRRQLQASTPHIFCWGLFYGNPSQHQRSFWGMLGRDGGPALVPGGALTRAGLAIRDAAASNSQNLRAGLAWVSVA